MVINESKKEFGFKLLDYYAKLMKEYSKSNDEDPSCTRSVFYLSKVERHWMDLGTKYKLLGLFNSYSYNYS